ncbi:MAG: hypothetical protein ABIE23_01865 [archaeon]
MLVVWTRHARQRFFDRSIKYGINYGEVEQNILNQKVREKQRDDTIKTVFKVMDFHFTVIKEETKKYINVVTLWESNEKEVELWKKKK